jgi:hypothetical protein
VQHGEVVGAVADAERLVERDAVVGGDLAQQRALLLAVDDGKFRYEAAGERVGVRIDFELDQSVRIIYWSDHLLSDHLLSDHLLSDHLLSDHLLGDHLLDMERLRTWLA